ncbi:gp10 [Brochothrix phage A9]|uniref:Gp10 n=1 Tax=Brochothrix phage A9 TaxID=857312 RepID=D9J0F7_9CAUD|nr:gp10 [Brochothrix phage A9]ADJ53052.1 gp10 [Brochothrix phage A9]
MFKFNKYSTQQFPSLFSIKFFCCNCVTNIFIIIDNAIIFPCPPYVLRSKPAKLIYNVIL